MKPVTSIFVALLFSAVVFAEPKAGPLRIEFKRGKNSATYTNSIKGSEEAEYVAEAMPGQQLKIRIIAEPERSVAPEVKDPTHQAMKLSFNGKDSWTTKLPTRGDYFISLKRTEKDEPKSRYVATIWIR